MRELTRRHGVPLIADEVLTGFGRTGRLFACEHGPVAPDLLCLSKALTGGYLPLAATLASDEIYGAFLSTDRSRTFFHGHSFTGNALACAVALESLALFEEEDRLGRIARLERLFAGRLAALASHPAVAAVRSLGAMAALELAPASAGGYLDDARPAAAPARQRALPAAALRHRRRRGGGGPRCHRRRAGRDLSCHEDRNPLKKDR